MKTFCFSAVPHIYFFIHITDGATYCVQSAAGEVTMNFVSGELVFVAIISYEIQSGT